jgi:hypothetical protein
MGARMQRRFARGVGLLVALLGFAQFAHAQDAVSLVAPFKQGVARYKTTTKIDAMGNEVLLTDLTRVVVKEVKADGTGIMVRTRESGTVSLAGMEQNLPPSESTETRDKLGRLTEFKSEPSAGFVTPGLERLSATLAWPLLTDQPVKPGDTWQVEIDNPAAPGKKVVVKDTFVAVDTIDGVAYRKIRQVTSADTGQNGTMAVDMTLWLDPKTSEIFKAEATVKDVPTQFGVLTWTTKVERLP